MEWDALATGGASSKRKRSSRSSDDLRKLRGIIASSKFNKLHPYSTHGKLRLERGTPISLEAFGASRRSATAAQKANRDLSGFTGRGLYTGRGRYNLRHFGHDLMNTFRTVSRSGGLKGMAKAFTGQGLYVPHSISNHSRNVLIRGGKMPLHFSSPNDETQTLIISNEEYIGDIYGPASSLFVNTKYELNPGLIQNFPMLSQFAANFDEYEWVQLIFTYQSTVDTSSTNNASGNTGTIMMNTRYDPDAPLYSDKQEMLNNHTGHSGRLVEELEHGVECDPKKLAITARKYVRSNPVPDLKLTDIGTFQLAIHNCPTAFQNQQIGELHVKYTVKLTKPKIQIAQGGFGMQTRLVSNGGATAPTAWLGTSPLRAQNSNFAVSVANSGNGIATTFPAEASGVYEITIRAEGTGIAAGAGSPIALTGNVTAFNDLYGSAPVGTAATYTTLAVSATAVYMCVRVRVQPATGGVNNQVFMSPLGAGSSTSIAQTYYEIREVGSQFTTSDTIDYPVWLNSIRQVTQVA